MEGKRGSECLLKPVSNIDFNPTDSVDLKIDIFDTLNLHLPTNNTDFTKHNVDFAGLHAAISQAEK